MPDQILDDPRIQQMIRRAASDGATEALQRIGLHDEAAARDVTELRSLIGAWRQTKAEAGRTVVHWLTVVGLSFIAFIVSVKFGVYPKWGQQ